MKRWGKYIKPYITSFILGPLCMIVEVVGDVIMPLLLALILKMAKVDPETGKMPLTVGMSIGISLAMLGIVILMLLGGVGGAYFGSKASVNFATDLRKTITTLSSIIIITYKLFNFIVSM